MPSLALSIPISEALLQCPNPMPCLPPPHRGGDPPIPKGGNKAKEAGLGCGGREEDLKGGRGPWRARALRWLTTKFLLWPAAGVV